MIIFMIIASPHYLSRVKEYSQLLLCEERNHITNVGQSGILELVMIRTSAFYVNFPYFFFLQGLLKVYDYYEPDVVVDHKYKIKQTCGTKLAIPYFNQTGESYSSSRLLRFVVKAKFISYILFFYRPPYHNCFYITTPAQPHGTLGLNQFGLFSSFLLIYLATFLSMNTEQLLMITTPYKEERV